MTVDAEILRLRTAIDGIDRELMQLLARRFQYCLEVGARKKAMNIPVMQSGRVTEVTDRAAQAAVDAGLSAEFGRGVWHLIIEEACALEYRMFPDHGVAGQTIDTDHPDLA